MFTLDFVNEVLMKRNEMNVNVWPALFSRCLSLTTMVSCFNERATRGREARGLHLSDRPSDSKFTVSMLILPGAPWVLHPLAC